MNEKQARERGYHYTGIYERGTGDIRQKLVAIRKQGYKAIIVTIPDSPYSRGIVGKGYAIYVDSRYIRDKTRNEMTRRLETLNKEREYALKQYQEQIVTLDGIEKSVRKTLEELGNNPQGDKCA